MSCKDRLLRLKSFLEANPQLAADAEHLKTIDELLSGKYVIIPREEIRDAISISDQDRYLAAEERVETTRTMTFAAHSRISVSQEFLKTYSDEINKMLFETLIEILEDEKKDFE